MHLVMWGSLERLEYCQLGRSEKLPGIGHLLLTGKHLF